MPDLGVYLGAVRPRLLERPVWRWRHRGGLPELTPEAFRSRFPYGGERDFLARFAAGYAARYPLARVRRAEYVAALGRWPSVIEAVLAAADQTCRHEFDVLGSGPVALGAAIDWHRDFKSGRTWPRDPAWRLDYTNLDEPSDVKVPWELSRFHFIAWLGQAYWVTGNERYAEVFGELLKSWLDANPPGLGINWAVPMELSIRAANWIRGFGWFHGSPRLSGRFWERVLASLWRHGEVVRWNLEYQRRLNNHYLSNGMGLLVMGAFFGDTRTGRAWAARGRRILEREIRRQVHPDGVDYEKSVSYHRLVLECLYVALLDAEAMGPGFSPGFGERLEPMFEFVAAYTRPDGSTPLVSDADDSRVFRFSPADPPTDHRHALAVGSVICRRSTLKRAVPDGHVDLLWLLGPAGLETFDRLASDSAEPSTRAFPQGGYYVMRGPDCHTFLDAGEIGFDGDAGHGHNDTLGFELYAPGGAFIVDSGTYLYTSDPAAHRAFAATAAHNTVRVDGREIAEFAGLWHVVEDRTAPRVLEWVTTPEEDRWTAEHRGYARLPRGVVHRRSVRFERAPRRWTIVDSLLGSGRHLAEGFLHLSPLAVVERRGPAEVLVTLGEGALRIRCSAPMEIERGWVAPRYGIRLEAPVLRIRIEDDAPLELTTHIEWLPAGEGRDRQEDA